MPRDFGRRREHAAAVPGPAGARPFGDAKAQTRSRSQSATRPSPICRPPVSSI